jgi:hypothetical protein
MAAAWKEPRVRVISTLALGAILYALGHNSIFQGVLYSIVPGLDRARVPSAAMLVFQVSIAGLAAFGVDHLASPWTVTVRRCLVGFGALTLAASLWVIFTNKLTFPGDDRVILTGAIALLAAAVLYARPAATPVLLILLLLVEFGNYSQIYFVPRNDAAQMATLHQIRGHSDIAGFLRGQPGFPRAEVAADAFAANWGAYHAVEMHGGRGASVTTNVLESDYFSEQGRRAWGVAFVIAKSPPPDAVTEVFATSDGWKVYRRDASPRTWPIHAVPCGAPDRVELIEHAADRLAIRAEMACDGAVVLSDTFYPGWRARVDHQPAEIFAANGAMRAVTVPRGSHTVTMRYRPISVYAGAVLTLLGVAVALAASRLSRPL